LEDLWRLEKQFKLASKYRMDKLTGEVIKSPTLTAISAAGSELAYRLQENVYGRPNDLKGFSEFLQNPDYLTSFTYPLTLMYMMRSLFVMGKYMDKQMGGNQIADKIYDIGIKLTPIVAVGLNVWHELASKPDYTDHPALDILAGCTAGMVYVLTTTPKEELKGAMQKIGSKFKRHAT